MPFFHLGLFGPETLWLSRVLVDLSDLRDQGRVDEIYLRGAWRALMRVAVTGTSPDQGERGFLLDMVNRAAGIDDDAGEDAVTVDEVLDDDNDRASDAVVDPDDLMHFDPGFRLAGRRWDFHMTDADSNRPAPHGHDAEDHRVVFDPYTGEVFGPNGARLRSAKDKELDKLWKNNKFRAFATQARAQMQTHQPLRADAIPPLPIQKSNGR